MRFESDVIPDSGKTSSRVRLADASFESDVIPDSGKTPPQLYAHWLRLRVM